MSPVAGALAAVGVKAVVEGLTGFKIGVGVINKTMGSITDTAKKVVSIGLAPLNLAVKGVGEVFRWFGNTVQRIVEYAFGYLLGNAIRDAIRWFKDLLGQVISAGDEFQILELRLNGINFQTLVESGMSFNDAIKASIELTRDQLSWLQTLAAATPFNAEDIAQTYTLARSLGFTDDETRQLTKDITDFSAGMGLASDSIERILYNFAQMRQRGKVTMTEVRDLARGALLPIGAIYERMAQNMGVEVSALQKMISKPGGGVDPQEFITAFQQMVQQEPRFIGAAGRLARTFKGATNNVIDLARSIGGLSIVKPVLDKLGDAVAKLVDEFVYFDQEGNLIKTQTWTDMVAGAEKLGKALSDVVGAVLDLLPSGDSLVESLLGGMDTATMWLQDNKQAIVDWADTAIAKISEVWALLFGTSSSVEGGRGGGKNRQKLGVPQATQQSKPYFFGQRDEVIKRTSGTTGEIYKLFKRIETTVSIIANEAQDIYKNIIAPFLFSPGQGWGDLWQALKDTGSALAGVGSEIWKVIKDVFQIEGNTSLTDWLNNEFVPGLKEFSQWISDNQENLSMLAGFFLTLAKYTFIGAAAITFLGAVVKAVIGGFIISQFAFLGAQVEFTYNLIMWLTDKIRKSFVDISISIGSTLETLKTTLDETWTAAEIRFGEFVNAMKRLLNVTLIPAINAIIEAINTARIAMGTGDILMVPIPLLPTNEDEREQRSTPRGSVTSPNQVANTFNMTVNTGARTSTVISDFGMMQSMAG